MIEEVQDKINSLLSTGLEANLAALRAPVGGTALPLVAPNKYLINYDPDTSMIPMNMLPAVIQMPEKSPVDHRTQNGIHVYWHHNIRIALVLSQLSTNATALDAVETLQRQRSRYARAIIKTLWAGQQQNPLTQIILRDILYSKPMMNAEEDRFLGSVWLLITAVEYETI